MFPRPDRALACTNSSPLPCGNICCCKGTEKGKTFKIKRYGNETLHRKTGCPNDCDAHQEPMCHALSYKWPDNLHAFAWQFACNYTAIQLQLPDNLVAIASQFAAIAQITCVTKARNDVFMLVHAGVDGRTPNGGFLVGKCLFDVFNAFG